jgi:hypothetical protein
LGFPEQVAEKAARVGCHSIAFTYNDPVIFAEYAIDCAQAAYERGIKRVAVTAGYINPEPRRVFCAYMDAANVDLKAFTGVDLGTERSAMIPERNSPSGVFFTPSGASNTRRMAGC